MNKVSTTYYLLKDGEEPKGEQFTLIVGNGMNGFRDQIALQGDWLRHRFPGVDAIERKALRVWNAVAAGHLKEPKESQRIDALSAELRDLLACSAVTLVFEYPDEMPLDGRYQLVKRTTEKKKKQRKSNNKRKAR